MANSIRTPRKGITASSEMIAQAVDNEEWQKFRVSLKGETTRTKLLKLKEYYKDHHVGKFHVGGTDEDREAAFVLIRVDNYIKALCRGGLLHPGMSLQTMLDTDWDLKAIKRG